MPRLSRWFVRAALLHLALGFTLGGLLLANKGLAFYPPTWFGLPSHMEFLLIGWMVNLAFGVAFWILPRFVEGPPRGNEHLAWVSFACLNLGIWLVAAGPLVGSPGLALAGRIAEALSAIAFAASAWKRVRAFKS